MPSCGLTDPTFAGMFPRQVCSCQEPTTVLGGVDLTTTARTTACCACTGHLIQVGQWPPHAGRPEKRTANGVPFEPWQKMARATTQGPCRSGCAGCGSYVSGRPNVCVSFVLPLRRRRRSSATSSSLRHLHSSGTSAAPVRRILTPSEHCRGRCRKAVLRPRQRTHMAVKACGPVKAWDAVAHQQPWGGPGRHDTHTRLPSITHPTEFGWTRGEVVLGKSSTYHSNFDCPHTSLTRCNCNAAIAMAAVHLPPPGGADHLRPPHSSKPYHPAQRQQAADRLHCHACREQAWWL